MDKLKIRIAEKKYDDSTSSSSSSSSSPPEGAGLLTYKYRGKKYRKEQCLSICPRIVTLLKKKKKANTMCVIRKQKKRPFVAHTKQIALLAQYRVRCKHKVRCWVFLRSAPKCKYLFSVLLRLSVHNQDREYLRLASSSTGP